MIIVAKNAGFCKGVERAVSMAKDALSVHKEEKVYSLGKLIHNEQVVKELEKRGLIIADDISDIENGSVVIIRCHGEGKKVFEALEKKNCTVINTTCPFVEKIHRVVEKEYLRKKQIIILGDKNHSEVVGINGYCEDSAKIFSTAKAAEEYIDTVLSSPLGTADKNSYYKPAVQNGLQSTERRVLRQGADLQGCDEVEGSDFCVLSSPLGTAGISIVAQTTLRQDILEELTANLQKKLKEKNLEKNVDFFNTVCHTTYTRQVEAVKLAEKSVVVLVVGSKQSANTKALLSLTKEKCPNSYLVENTAQLDAVAKKIKTKERPIIGIIAGASTPKELIVEVRNKMAKKFENDIQSEELKTALKKSSVNLREGQRVKGSVIAADEKGVFVNLETKKDAFIPKDEACVGEYNIADFPKGLKIVAIITAMRSEESGCILLSKKKIDAAQADTKEVDAIRGGDVFEIMIDSAIKGGLLGKMGSYSVFVPASQVREKFVTDLTKYEKKPMRLTVLEIDDQKKKIVASAKKLVAEERRAKEEIFWNNVVPDVIVEGTVKRITAFGAFVSVDGFDCLVHVSDVSHKRVNSAADVLKVGEKYEFLVIATDREKNKVSLSYKALQPSPMDKFIAENPIGSTVKGKVASIAPFGAFVSLSYGLEGLVHLSEISNTFVQTASEGVKIGEEVEALVKDIDPSRDKISLSIKALKQDEDAPEGEKPKRKKAAPRGKKEEASIEWKEEASNSQLADLLKNVKLDEETEEAK